MAQEFIFKTRSGEVPASQMTADDLEWYAKSCKSVPMRQAAEAEIERRMAEFDKPPAQQQQMTLARPADVQIMTGAFRDPSRATDALQQASAMGHLVAPAPICGAIPEGCAMALAAVQIDPVNETYKISGKLGLSKVALDKISAAAGVSWDVRESKRLDDGSDPRYCHYKAVGRVRDFDGTIRVIQGEVEMDARDGSPLIDEIVTKAKNASPPRDPTSQIIELRKFLLRHAESKAKNRAIRSLGVRTAYTADELKKPFVVAKVQFTGDSSDPELRKIFASKIADGFLGAQAALYGAPLSNPALPAAPEGHAPPPLDATGEDVEDDDDMPPARPSSQQQMGFANADKF